MIALEDVLTRLDDMRRSGRGWIARCPAHGDRTPSLSIAVGADGRVLLHDFAGCSYREILHAWNLEATAGARTEHSADVHALALSLARAQRWADPLAREIAALSRYVREPHRAAQGLRHAAVVGDAEAGWELLARAAAHDREAFRVEAVLDEVVA